jgi:hypothetical protein
MPKKSQKEKKPKKNKNKKSGTLEKQKKKYNRGKRVNQTKIDYLFEKAQTQTISNIH